MKHVFTSICIILGPLTAFAQSESADSLLSQDLQEVVIEAFAVAGRSDFKLTDKLKVHRNYTETFTHPDGSALTRNETTRGGSLDVR